MNLKFQIPWVLITKNSEINLPRRFNMFWVVLFIAAVIAIANPEATGVVISIAGWLLAITIFLGAALIGVSYLLQAG